MKQKERHFVYEGMAMLVAGMFGAFAVPTLLSTRDSVVAVCGGILFIGWLCWFAFWLYRINGRLG